MTLAQLAGCGEHRDPVRIARLTPIEKPVREVAPAHTLKRPGLYETLATPIAGKSWDLGMENHCPEAIIESDGFWH